MKSRILAVAIFSGLIFGATGNASFAEDQKLGEKDMKFLKKASSGGMMEVKLGLLANKKAQTQDVKNFGAMIANDHKKANEELKKILESKKVMMPADLEPDHKKVIETVSKSKGKDLDKLYMREMVKNHASNIAQFQKAAEEVTDADLKDWAKNTLPTLEQHLRHAKAIASKSGVDVKRAEEEGQQEAGK